jgi:hypothetical protein
MRNAHLLRGIVGQAQAAGISVLLWGLDGVVPGMEALTHGDGPGTRSALLSGLASEARDNGARQVIICDDDVEFVVGSLGDLVEVSVQCGFAMSQPAHTWDSNFSYTFTAGRPAILARWTDFVEIGPVLLVAEHFLDRVLPFPEGAGMGWGLEAEWSRLRTAEDRFGIVDYIRMRHLGSIGADYSAMAEETRRLAKSLGQIGRSDLKELCRTRGRWMPWRSRPGWVAVRSDTSRSIEG